MPKIHHMCLKTGKNVQFMNLNHGTNLCPEIRMSGFQIPTIVSKCLIVKLTMCWMIVRKTPLNANKALNLDIFFVGLISSLLPAPKN